MVVSAAACRGHRAPEESSFDVFHQSGRQQQDSEARRRSECANIIEKVRLICRRTLGILDWGSQQNNEGPAAVVQEWSSERPRPERHQCKPGLVLLALWLTRECYYLRNEALPDKTSAELPLPPSAASRSVASKDLLGAARVCVISVLCSS